MDNATLAFLAPKFFFNFIIIIIINFFLEKQSNKLIFRGILVFNASKKNIYIYIYIYKINWG